MNEFADKLCTHAAICMNLQEDPINIKYDNSDKIKEIS